MSESNITGGLVVIEDGVKAAEEYAPAKKVRVELKFDIPEGGDFGATFASVTRVAENWVALRLGRTVPSVVETGRSPEPEASAAPNAETAPRKRRTKAEIAADEAAAAQAAAQAKATETIQNSEEFDPTADNTPTTTQGSTDFDPCAAIEPETADDLDAILGGEATPEITDADLNAAVQKKNAALQDPPAIRKLISEFNPDPTKVFQLREIAASKRADFIAKLEALVKA